MKKNQKNGIFFWVNADFPDSPSRFFPINTFSKPVMAGGFCLSKSLLHPFQHPGKTLEGGFFPIHEPAPEIIFGGEKGFSGGRKAGMAKTKRHFQKRQLHGFVIYCLLAALNVALLRPEKKPAPWRRCYQEKHFSARVYYG